MRPSVVQCISKVSAVVIVVFSLVDIVQAGPARPLYLSTGSQIQVLQFNSIIDSWTTGEQEFSIAVDMTVRTWSQGNQFLSLLGKEYLLDGTPTGATYANDVGCCFRERLVEEPVRGRRSAAGLGPSRDASSDGAGHRPCLGDATQSIDRHAQR